jgi:general secretion pathway protein G
MRRNRQSAFTLIELVVVVVILSMLALVLAPKVFKGLGKSKTGIARVKMLEIQKALVQFKVDCGRLPDASEGLDALLKLPSADLESKWDGPYCKPGDLLDPWERPYLYEPGTDAAGEEFVLRSLGKDGQVGGTGEDQDVTSEETPPAAK